MYQILEKLATLACNFFHCRSLLSHPALYNTSFLYFAASYATSVGKEHQLQLSFPSEVLQTHQGYQI